SNMWHFFKNISAPFNMVSSNPFPLPCVHSSSPWQTAQEFPLSIRKQNRAIPLRGTTSGFFFSSSFPLISFFSPPAVPSDLGLLFLLLQTSVLCCSKNRYPTSGPAHFDSSQ
uniref:Uncharacterized protein n=1 Tax=Zonotrichia albicollis TaxID=44394 RepID=A0A8D2NCG7_ZONAL